MVWRRPERSSGEVVVVVERKHRVDRGGGEHGLVEAVVVRDYAHRGLARALHLQKVRAHLRWR